MPRKHEKVSEYEKEIIEMCNQEISLRESSVSGSKTQNIRLSRSTYGLKDREYTKIQRQYFV